ncbi:MAG TPA: hypothetical protein VGO49_08025 [Bradyrhizobium sp.]|jgi:hypothetical protein|nr:hypothetical protein [Bradyrhizobium sp.]
MSMTEVNCTAAGAQHKAPNAGDPPAKTASVALVPVVAAARRLTPAAHGLARPDPSFVTHLIAMAELSPQTRTLRRAAPEDVQAAYRSVANQNRTMTPPGVRMRQIA